MNDRFLPNDYQPPTNEGKYLKFKEKETRFRFLASPIRGWLGWKDRKPIRREALGQFQPADVDGGDLTKVRHFWAAPVWGYAMKRVQVVEITQATIQRGIYGLSRNEDWGTPLDYDIIVTSSAPGSMETEYAVFPAPKRPPGETIQRAWYEAQKAGFDLSRLWTGGDPFGDSTQTATVPGDVQFPGDDIPF